MKHILISAAICSVPFIATAGTVITETAPIETPPSASEWEFRIEPYAWLTAVDGSTGPQGFTADVDAGFDDIVDVLDFSAALQFEARRGRWGLIADAFYAELSISGTLPGPLQTNIDMDFEQFVGELEIFYRVSDCPQYFVDLYAGVRYNSLSLDLVATSDGPILDINERRSGDKDWLDPIVGLRSQWDLTDRWFLAAKGDIGGFGVDSDFTWNLQGTVGYKFSETVSLEVGYRYFDTDYSDGGFVYDVAQAGVLIGLNIYF